MRGPVRIITCLGAANAALSLWRLRSTGLCRVAELLEEAGLGGGALWMKGWKAKWEVTLSSCGEGAGCLV